MRRILEARSPAYFHLSRDPEGRDIAWTLAGDVDPEMPVPGGG